MRVTAIRRSYVDDCYVKWQNRTNILRRRIFVSLVPLMSEDLLAYQHVSTLENGLFIQMLVQNKVTDLFVSF